MFSEFSVYSLVFCFGSTKMGCVDVFCFLKNRLDL